MSRLPELAPDRLTPEQQRVRDAIAKVMGGTARGPFAALLSRPEIAEPVFALYRAYRDHGKLDRRLFELMILVAARDWTAQYAWFVHESHAVNFGLSQAVVDAIRERRRPDFTRDDEALVYDVTREFLDHRMLGAATWDRGVAVFGHDLMLELITGIGFYQMIATILVGLDVPVPGEKNPLS